MLSAMRRRRGYSKVTPQKKPGMLTVRDAIFGLGDPLYFRRDIKPEDIPVHQNHWTMQPKSPRFSDPQSMDNSKGKSFKKLFWDKPSRTLAFGHREIHVHPNGNRRLSIFEAMLLQGFPVHFVLEGNLSEQAEQVSNAVPPPLAQSIAEAVKSAMVRKKYVRKL